MRKKLEARPLLVFVGAFMTVLFFISGQVRTVGAVTVNTEMSGELLKGSSPIVYFVGTDNKRYVFPTEKVFYSWYADFSTVKTVTDDEINSIPIGGSVTYRPGARLVKIPSDPKVYAVTASGELRWVSTEELATQLFGADWAKKVDDLTASDFTNYQTGAAITQVGDYNVGANNTAPPPTNQNENTNNNINSPPASGDVSADLKIVSVSASADSANPQAWDFQIVFSQPPSGARLTVVEKNIGTVFYNEPVIREQTSATTAHVAIGASTVKLKPATVYSWKVVAYSALNATAAQTATASGDFTTAADTSVAPPSATAISVFKIVSVTVNKVDPQGKPAEDVRSFKIVFSKPPIGARLTIGEKSTGLIFDSESITSGEEPSATVNVSSVNWTTKLKPSTTYTWKVTANGMTTAMTGSQLATETASGEFTTSDFTSNPPPAATTK